MGSVVEIQLAYLRERLEAQRLELEAGGCGNLGAMTCARLLPEPDLGFTE